MESTAELQQLEITALKSIYAEDFSEVPPPKAWKNAARLPEFTIKVSHPATEHASKIFLHLNVKLPKTYPTLACPTFSIVKPMSGLNNNQITTLSHVIHAEAQRNKGAEMVFQIITFAQEWLARHISPPLEAPGSLATQMTQRALEEEKIKRERDAQEAEKELERAALRASELTAQIQADAQRQLLAKQQHTKVRHTAASNTPEAPHSDTPTESFDREIEFGGLKFTTVKIFHPCRDNFGIIYLADPLCDDVNATLPLELYTITFTSQYYSTNQGRKKLKQLEAEILRLTELQHPNLLRVLAVKLSLSHSSESPRMVILSEQRSPLTLEDVLLDCESLREDCVSDYVAQILSGLNVLHGAELVHRGINARCLGLVARERRSHSKLVKLGNVSFGVRLLDLHKSNPIGTPLSPANEDAIPDTWLSKEMIDSPLLYTPARDLHCIGLVLLQMLLGHDVMTRFTDVQSALHNSSVSTVWRQLVLNMVNPSKKNPVSCLSLLADLAGRSFGLATRKAFMQIPNTKTPLAIHPSASPEIDYFRPMRRLGHASRWKEDWEELELLGKGAFGSVVKARNKIDERTYAVKKIKLRTSQSDSRIFREVNALSRLSHRFIVRYYTTWVETSEPSSTGASDMSGSDSGTDSVITSVPASASRVSNDRIDFTVEDLDDISASTSSFPSIHFGHSGSSQTASDDEGSSESVDDFGNLFGSEHKGDLAPSITPPAVARTLYIQMEFVERQTLKERIAEGLTEDEAWGLFQQILDALVHMSTLGILHRDIKLTNIFIDGNGDCKVGDFGLATSSLAAVDPSDVSHHVPTTDAEMTLEVGTRLYIAPEVLSKKRGPRNHLKADLYSLGIVFFEMNFPFSTGAERISVIEYLRQVDIIFPPEWPVRLKRQRQIITSLLQHDPDDRPTALELSRSPLLPPRLEDEYFKGALNMIAKPDSPHYQAVLSSLFNQSPRLARGFLYDLGAELPDYAPLNDPVQARLVAIFKLHGAVDMEPPLLMPVTTPSDEPRRATFIDRHGDIVMLPKDLLLPFARLGARANIRRIKRFHIANVYRPNAVSGHPKATKAAVLDMISPDLESGPTVSAAELIAISIDCLNSFPNLAAAYDLHISHSKIVEITLSRIPSELRTAVTDIVTQSRSSVSQKRALLLKRGLLRSIADELEVLNDADENVSELLLRVEKVSPTLLASILPYVDDIKQTIQYVAAFAGPTKQIYFRPLMLGSHHDHFKDGVRFEVVRRNRWIDVLAAGGRYDNVISRYSPPKQQDERTCAVGLQIAVEKITIALAAYQREAVKTLVKEQRSFGFWSPRRCDVYILSYQPGYLQDRIEIAAYLWQHNISADIMYESALSNADHDNHEDLVELCEREGILFTLYPRPRTARRDQPAFKIKSVLRGTEYELSRQELIGWLQQQIAEQKRVDASTYGASALSDPPQSALPSKEVFGVPDVQLLLPGDVKMLGDPKKVPGDAKKQRRQVKQLFLDRAYDAGMQLKSAVQSGIPTIAVDVPVLVFDALTKSSAWLSDEEAWKGISSGIASQSYAHLVREAVLKKRAEGYQFVLLFAVREERVHVFNLG